ncbi:carotenoid oxygenase family protein [Pyxidicoccus parkwayensis]|uniref:Carotenoid oxygenase family protein n=1 Tax=Pyxidicoccus parkwayensis TaxID=2813578 RepID=A0ABX7P5K2_9BACT|nr:carotenoid oxygenase family protein [Pyxidicoccus parkwaysis]QSQ25728.1 carotenoid oxygenase family protein [Pyxidicoccus parkwaysis]
MREADPAPKPDVPFPRPPAGDPPQPDGHDYPGLVVPPGPRPGMPHNTMTTSPVEYVDEPLKVLAGKLPPDLQGHVFVAGPSVHAGAPALASDGLVLRLDFLGGSARFTSATMRTPSYYARQSVDEGATARGPLTRYLNQFRDTTLTDVSLTLGVQETPNTAPFLVEGEKMLLVTTDAGRPWAIHPRTLKAYTPLGYNREWNRAIPAPWTFPLLQSTAHPAFDSEPPQPLSPEEPDRQRPRLFFTNHAPKWPLGNGYTQLVSWDTQENRLHHWKLMDAATGKPVVTASLHQIGATRDYVILLDSNFPINFWQIASQAVAPWLPGSKRVVEWLSSEPSYPQAVFWVVKRADLRPSPGTLSAEDPPVIPAYRFQSGGGGLHFAALYENPDDVITLVAGHSPTEDLSHTLEKGELLINGNHVQDWQVGMPTAVPVTRSSLGVHKIDMKRLRIQSNLYSHDDYTWGLTVFSNAGLVNGELETNLRLNHTPVNAKVPPEELAIYFNSDGFCADMVPERLYQLYKPIVGEKDSLPIQEGRAASFFKFFVHTGRFDGYVLPTGWFGFAPQFVPSARFPAVSHWKGYMVALVVSDPTPDLPKDSTGDEVWIFDSQDIAKGPICRLGSSNFDIGMTLHTTFLPSGLLKELDGHPDDHSAPYVVDVKKDFDIEEIEKTYLEWPEGLFPRVPKVLFAPWRLGVKWALNFPKLRQVLEEDVYPHFPRKPNR